jgi:putative N6-adenine-specific DNA methylase
MKYKFLATCSFGLEAIVKQEAVKLGFGNIEVFDARVYFEGDESDLAKANLWFRCADRVYIVIDEFFAYTFEELFQGVKKINWSEYIDIQSAFPVTGDSVRSKLFSVSDVQKITKKAIVEKLKEKHKISYFEESENKILVHIAILKDKVSVLLNTSGAGLNRRGYRRLNAQAPLRETLAAGLLYIAQYKEQPLYDPMCGSGTIIIEAAMMSKNIAPGNQRKFAFESFDFLDLSKLTVLREEVKDSVIKGKVEVYGSDVDEEVLGLCRVHAKTAGVFDHIEINRADIKQALNGDPKGILVTNPPYAERMGEKKEVEVLYRKMGNIISPLNGLKAFIISADMSFERFYGAKADKKRKLYNGSIKCNYYQYFRGKKTYFRN